MAKLASFMSKGANWLALSVIAGIAVPPLAALFRPLLFPSIFFLVLCSLLLMDLPRVFAGLKREIVPASVIAAWQLLVLPTGFAAVHLYTPLGGPYTLIAFFTACAGSLFGSSAFARLMGLDEEMTLKGTILSVLVMPLTLPAMAAWVRGHAEGFDVVGYSTRLCVFLVLPIVIGFVVQAHAGLRSRVRGSALVRHGGVFFLCVFAIGVMDGIGPRIIASPVAMTGLLLLAFAMHLGLFALTVLVFSARGRTYALTAGLLSSYRNLGLLLAVAGSLLPRDFIVFVALWQIPMYLMPLAMARFGVRRAGKAR